MAKHESKFLVNDDLALLISERLIFDLTAGDSKIQERSLAYARARQQGIYDVLGHPISESQLDQEIRLLFAVSWLYQHNGDYESDEKYYQKACALIESSYGKACEQAGNIGLGAVSEKKVSN
ncbi:MAG: hypothetical protein ACRCVN_05120 [Spirochaetia bacterium]